jgi:hypothetical protein
LKFLLVRTCERGLAIGPPLRAENVVGGQTELSTSVRLLTYSAEGSAMEARRGFPEQGARAKHSPVRSSSRLVDNTLGSLPRSAREFMDKAQLDGISTTFSN